MRACVCGPPAPSARRTSGGRPSVVVPAQPLGPWRMEGGVGRQQRRVEHRRGPPGGRCPGRRSEGVWAWARGGGAEGRGSLWAAAPDNGRGAANGHATPESATDVM